MKHKKKQSITLPKGKGKKKGEERRKKKRRNKKKGDNKKQKKLGKESYVLPNTHPHTQSRSTVVVVARDTTFGSGAESVRACLAGGGTTSSEALSPATFFSSS